MFQSLLKDQQVSCCCKKPDVKVVRRAIWRKQVIFKKITPPQNFFERNRIKVCFFSWKEKYSDSGGIIMEKISSGLKCSWYLHSGDSADKPVRISEPIAYQVLSLCGQWRQTFRSCQVLGSLEKRLRNVLNLDVRLKCCRTRVSVGSAFPLWSELSNVLANGSKQKQTLKVRLSASKQTVEELQPLMFYTERKCDGKEVFAWLHFVKGRNNL